MYNYKEKKIGVKGFKISNSKEIVGSTNRDLFIDNLKISENVDTTTGSLKIFENFLFFDKAESSCIFDLFNQKVYNTNGYRALPFTLQNNKVICSYNSIFINNQFQWKTGLYDLVNNRLEKEFLLLENISIAYYINKDFVIIFLNRQFLGGLLIEDSLYKWKLDLSVFGEISNILGLVHDKLWVLMHRSGIESREYRLMAIDINNGEILFVLPTEFVISDVSTKLLESKQTLLSIYSKWSTAPADSFFVEINANTNSVLRSGKIESLYNENLKIAEWQVLGGKIFFTANKDFLNATHIGVLDYATLDLLWVTEVIDRKAGLKDLQVTEDKIYVLDMGGTLHVYEKEKTAN